MRKAEMDRVLLSDPAVVAALRTRKFEYHALLADQIVEVGGSTRRLVETLQQAGLPVSTREVTTYWSWKDRHVYDPSDSKTWIATSRRRVRTSGRRRPVGLP